MDRSPSLPVITFVARTVRDRWSDIADLGLPDEFADRIRSGVDVWIVSTYLELRSHAEHHGFRVAIGDRFPPGGPAVAHRDDLRPGTGYSSAFVAAARADRPCVHLAAWQAVQNPLQQGERAVHIPSWPQPGLVRRDSRREGIAVLGYLGRTNSLPGFFGDPAFAAELAQRGVRFQCDERNWRDYSQTDACIGLRYEPEVGLATKPYTKLTNAWLAEVPALLGPEPAFRALRRSELDYIEVRCARDVLGALDRLRADPALYASMIENGRTRGRDFTRDAVAQRWCGFLAGDFLPAWRLWQERLPGTLSRRLDALRRLGMQWRETRRYKRLEAVQLAALRTSDCGERL